MKFLKPSGYNYFLPVKLVIIWLVLMLPHLASAQIDKQFWFVAPYVYDAGRDFDKPIVLRITTAASASTVTISMPANGGFTPIVRNIPANSTITVDLTAWIGQIQNTPANTILNRGLLISSTADITAYYEVVSSYCNCNPEIFSLKGKNALGNEFFISSQYSYDESTAYSGATNSFDVVATEDNTHITITPSKNIVGHSANSSFTITLNKGQTYSAVASSSSAAGHLQGSYIKADNPVAVTLKDDLVQVTSCADLAGDQTVPTSVLGTDYIVSKGYLQPYDNVYITAIEDGTAIYVDGNASPVTTLAKGASYTLNLSNPSTYIRSNNKIYVYHFTGNGCEVGSAIIPKINCTGSQSVSIVRSNDGLFAVTLTTKAGNQGNFSVNGNGSLINGSSFTAVPGTAGAYVSATINLSGSVAVGNATTFSNSSGIFSLGMLNGGSTDGTRYGFFSDFKSSNVTNSNVETCPGTPVQLNAYGGVTYQWTPATGLSNPNIANPTATTSTTTDYSVSITTADGCVDTAKVTVKVLSSVTPSVTIASSGNNVCEGTAVTFTATATDAGPTPVYQWQVNGINTGTNSSTFNSSTLTNGDKVTCLVTGSAGCTTPGSVSSNVITMAVNPKVTPLVSIAASQNNVCQGTAVTFTATPVNGGSTPLYQWLVNGINVGTNSNTPTFTTSSLVNGDKVSCVMQSNAACTTINSVGSTVITMAVTPNVTPSISISASQNNVCQGTPITFTATPVNGGLAPVYQWQVNGVNAGTNSGIFSSTTLNNGDRVTCILTSNASCAAPTTATSPIVIMAITPQVTPTISIVASANNICSGTSVTFTATPGNGGALPVYQWQVNGANVGTNSTTFTTSALANGNKVTCLMTSNSSCAPPGSVNSNIITMAVNPNVTPAVSIAVSQNNICQGTSVTFTATPANGGTAPTYQWLINGVNVGTNSSVPNFTSSTLTNGDKVSCLMQSNATCATPASVGSTVITMVVTPNVTPSVSISASQNNVCQGTLIIFTATPVNGGTAPTYQWQLNGANVGTNSPTLSSSSLNNGDRVTCTLGSNATCVTSNVATSQPLVMAINPMVAPSVSITASATSICPGTTVTFTATPVNGGATPVYQWQVNGITAGTNSSIFSSSTLTNGSTVRCVIRSNANCITTTTATSNSIAITLNPTVTPAVSISASANNVCAGTYITFTATPTNGGTLPVYEWLVNGTNAGGSNSNTFTSNKLNNNDVVSCILTSNAPCATLNNATSNTVTMQLYALPSVNAGSDKVIEKGTITQLKATASSNIISVKWSPVTGLDNPNILSPNASPEATTIYTVTVTSAGGCLVTDNVKVTVQSTVIAPNTFTPNGDGVNDKWLVKNLDDYPNCTVQIFNRWGQEVFRSRGYGTAWDGTYNGKHLPFATYYYLINLNNNSKPISGHVTIVR